MYASCPRCGGGTEFQAEELSDFGAACAHCLLRFNVEVVWETEPCDAEDIESEPESET